MDSVEQIKPASQGEVFRMSCLNAAMQFLIKSGNTMAHPVDLAEEIEYYISDPEEDPVLPEDGNVIHVDFGKSDG